MYEFLDSVGFLGIVLFFIVLFIACIYIFRSIFKMLSKKALVDKITIIGKF